MSENRLARALPNLLAQAEARLGLGRDYWIAIGLCLNRHEDLEAELADARTTDAHLHAILAAELHATATCQAINENLTPFLTLARNVLKIHLGHKWSQRWAQLNFPNYSLAIPQGLNDRLAILSGLVAYLTAHPEHEVPELDLTARQTAERRELLWGAMLAQDLRAERRTALRARDEAVRKLRRRLRHIAVELTMVIQPDDPRWFTFGLNQRSKRRTRAQIAADAKRAAAMAGLETPCPPPVPSLVGPGTPCTPAVVSSVRQASPRAEAETTPLRDEPATSAFSIQPLESSQRSAIRTPPLAFGRARRPKRSLLAWFLPS